MRPGRHLAHQPPVHAPNAALLIDFDNVTLGIRSDLTKELKTLLNSDIIKGKVAVQRAYADWRRYPQYIVSLSEASIDLIFAPAFGSNKKNATDIRLAVDATELVFTRPEIGTFILLSGDSDFSSLVLKLKEYGKYVIGVGIRESASDLLIQNCDEYYSYSDLAGLSREVEAPSVARDPWELSREAVAQMARSGDVMRSDRLKQVMQQLDSNFDERDAGFSRFSKFVVEAAQRGMLQATKLENGQFEVAPVGGAGGSAAAAAEAPAREERGPRERGERGERGEREGGRDERRGRRSRRGRGERERPETGEREAAPQRTDGALTLARAFGLMTDALTELGATVPHETLRLRMASLHGRDDALLEPARFLRLLRQANDAEVADVRRLSDDEYEVSPPRGAPRAAPVAPSAGIAGVGAEHLAAAAASAERADQAADAALAAAAPRESGVPAGLRFRRGSRGPLRPAEIPLVGVFRPAELPRTEESSRSAIGDAVTTASEPAGAVAPAAGPPAAATEEAAVAPESSRGGRGRGGRGRRGGGRGGERQASPPPVAEAAPAPAPMPAPEPAPEPSAAPAAKRAKGARAAKSAKKGAKSTAAAPAAAEPAKKTVSARRGGARGGARGGSGRAKKSAE
jgi:uncharacterized protein (TIGR00288 family)